MILPPLTKGMVIECQSTTNTCWTESKSYNVSNSAIYDNFGNRWIADMNPEMKFKIVFGENMKTETIMDAVNDLKGDLNNTYLYEDKDIYLYYIINSEDRPYVCSVDGVAQEDEIKICTTKEFNNLISQLETNFGKSITYSGYKEKHQSFNREANKVNPDDLVWVNPEHLVYTQEMKDNGQTPCTGMIVDVLLSYKSEETQEGKIVHVGQSFGNTRYVVQCQNWLNVFDIDQLLPIKSEVELIDGECYQFEFDGNTHKGYYEEKDKTLNWVFNHSKVDDCTNIKPLVLEDSNNE